MVPATGGVNILVNGGMVEGVDGVLMGKGKLGSVGIKGGNGGNGSEGTPGKLGRPVDGVGGSEGIGRVPGKPGKGKNKRRRAEVVWRLPEKERAARREKMMKVVEAISGGGGSHLGFDYI
ncbi:hypothetical protein L1987_31960 [Smallanthus sonchifolius]|uniref:Uncharacterized protein n=1 Tax=Smallanthus sonchifolius TaxID=185202 RepID=A0ACB9I6C7_9ASTR|nr:hypothetical protein L1987_31960 [Smallanthus sonchifolius]